MRVKTIRLKLSQCKQLLTQIEIKIALRSILRSGASSPAGKSRNRGAPSHSVEEVVEHAVATAESSLILALSQNSLSAFT